MVKILQVVGFKKSGKTTITNHMIRHLKARGYHIAVVKHHGDQSGQEIDIPQKRDHLTYMDSGADESIVQGYQYIHKLIAQSDTKDNQSLNVIIQNEITTNPDIILVEGYKTANYDKIVLYQNEQDLNMLLQLNFVKWTCNTSALTSQNEKAINAIFQQLEQFLNTWVDDTRETI